MICAVNLLIAINTVKEAVNSHVGLPPPLAELG